MTIIALCLIILPAYATVSITAATGGNTIPADKSEGSSASSFTSLGDITITSKASSDFALNQSNVTFVLSAPANWIFNTASGSVLFAGTTLSAASISVTPSEITVTYSTTASAANDNSITIKGIQVKSTSKAILPSATIKRTAGTGTISGFTNTGTVNCGTLLQIPGALKQLLILLPGEIAAPGTETGKTNLASPQAAGTQFSFTVYGVDENWNKVSSSPANAINISSSDNNAALPSNANLATTTASKSFNITLKTIGSSTITATNVSNPGITADVSTVAVLAGNFARLQLLLPGETANPGSANGKTGTPTAQTAGVPFNVTVNAVDAAWNVIPVTDIIKITSTDVNGVLPANEALVSGTKILSVILKTAGTKTLTATNVSDGSKTASTSPATIAPGTFAKLQLLLPGEAASPGSATGKTGTPGDRLAAAGFNFTVNAVDEFWNKVSSVTDVIRITSSDLYATLPADAALSSGTKTNFRITLKSPGEHTLTATNITNGSMVNTSATVMVTSGSFSRLQLLLPGETAAPGTTTGKIGTPTPRVAGVPFTIIVNAVDAAWNIVTTATDEVKITSKDVYADLPANASLVSGTSAFTITLKTAGSRTITATDVSDATKKANASPAFTVNPNTYTGLQLLLPGETAVPGSPTGKTGTPSTRLAGTYFYVTVTAVDAYWNKINTVTDLIHFSSTDNTAILPADAALVSGTKTNFRMTFRTIGQYTLTAGNVTNGAITPYTSPPVTVTAGTFYKLQVLLPGETAAPGSPTGKTGTPIAQTAGIPFNITVNAVDDAWNVISSAAPDIIKITSTDVNAVLPVNSTLPSGTKTFTVTLKTAGSKTITATDVTNGAIKSNASPAFTINPGAFSQLQILLPSEKAAPGTSDGKTGNPGTPARGISFNFVVNAVDDYFNKISTATDFITFSTSDVAATNKSAPNSLVAGTRTFTIRLNTPGIQTITATTGTLNTTVYCDDAVKLSAITDYFRSITSEIGDEPAIWSDPATWQSSTDGLTDWHAATLAPNANSNTISIQNGHTVTVASSVTADQIIVKEGGSLFIKSGVTLTLANGAGTDMEVWGTVLNSGAINTTDGNLVFQSTGKYQHLYTTSAGTIPLSTWNEESTCEISGYTSSAGTIGGANQSFYNLIWDCPNQNTTSGPSFGGTFNAVNFSVVSTGTGDLKLGTVSGTVNIKNYNQTGGTLTLNSSNSTVLTLNVSGNFSLSGGTVQKGTGSGTGKINFSGTGIQRFEKFAGTISGAVDFTISNGAKVDLGTFVLNGSSAIFNLNASGTIITANEEGLAASGSSGSIQTATRNFNTAANYIYNGDDAQVAGTGLPLTINNLTINNPAGLSMPATSANYTINGLLEMNGNLNMGTNNLVAGAGFSNSGPGILYTQSGSATPLSANKTWNVGIEYNSTEAQTIVPGTYSNISFSADGIKTSSPGTITITGNWASADGKTDLISNGTSVQFNGINQTLTDNDSDEGIIFKNVTFGNTGTKTLQSGRFSVSSSGLLSMSGNAKLQANGNLYILSNETGSGNIGPLSGGADITGDVNIQTFITGSDDINRGTRTISSPINDSGLSKKTFQQLKDYIIITGPGNTVNGFDYGGLKAPNAVTLQTYNEPAYSGAAIYSPVPSIAQPAVPGKGYFIHFRGNREAFASKLNAPYATPEDVVVTYTGPLNKNNISLPLTNTHNLAPEFPTDDVYNGYNLVGNPYASAIDWATVLANSSNLDNMVVVIKPGGGTATYINGESNGGASRYIQSGLGFYVKVKNTENTGSITFTESSKVGAATAATPSRLLSSPQNSDFLGASSQKISNAGNEKSRIRINILDDKSEDETTIVFKSGYSANAEDDAAYFSGSTVSLGSVSADGHTLAVNFMPDINEVSELKLWMNASESKNARLFFPEISGKNHTIVLQDNFLHTLTEIKSQTAYDFYIDKSIAESYGSGRFKLLIEPAKAAPLRILNFTAKRTENNTAELNWTSSDLSDIASFEVERSAGLSNFISIKQLDISAEPDNSTYKHIDISPLNGSNYYRLKQTDKRGNILYSNLQSVSIYLPADKKITVYPNPAQDETTILFENYDLASLITVYDLSGRKVIEATNQTGNSSIKLNTAALHAGIYVLEIRALKTGELISTTKLIRQ